MSSKYDTGDIYRIIWEEVCIMKNYEPSRPLPFSKKIESEIPNSPGLRELARRLNARLQINLENKNLDKSITFWAFAREILFNHVEK